MIYILYLYSLQFSNHFTAYIDKILQTNMTRFCTRNKNANMYLKKYSNKDIKYV